jgi:hypothetical protein
MRLFGVYVSLVFAAGCSSGSDQVFIGQEFSYSVPGQFVSANPPSPVPEGNSLHIPIELDDQGRRIDLDVPVLVFDDKAYSVEMVLGRLVSPQQGFGDVLAGIDERGYFVLESDNDGRVNTRYSTIDESGAATRAFVGLHHVAIRSAPDADEDSLARSKPVCQIHFALDGLAVQAQVSGEACAPEHFNLLVRDLQSSFEDWRILG